MRVPRSEDMRAFFMARNTAFLGEITSESAEQFMCDLAELAKLDAPHVDLVINSGGGDTFAGFSITEFIDYELGKPIHARVIGNCHSSGTFVLLCCHKRVSGPLSKFVIHRQTTSFEAQYDKSFDGKVESWKQEQAMILEELTDFYAVKLSITRRQAQDLMERGSGVANQMLSAREALKLGLLTKIFKMPKAP